MSEKAYQTSLRLYLDREGDRQIYEILQRHKGEYRSVNDLLISALRRLDESGEQLELADRIAEKVAEKLGIMTANMDPGPVPPAGDEAAAPAHETVSDVAASMPDTEPADAAEDLDLSALEFLNTLNE